MHSQITRTPTFRELRAVPLCFVLLALVAVQVSLGQTGVSVLNFGAVADGLMRTDGVMTVGSSVLISSSGSFTSGDIGKYIQVVGAGPGGTSHFDGSMAYNSVILTSGSGNFLPGDVGRGMVVVGAGPAGGNLIASIQTYLSPSSVILTAPAQFPVTGSSYFYGAMTLEGTIKSVQSSTTVTLTSAASSTISSAMFSYGTDNHAQFQSAVDATGQAGGGVVNVPPPSSCPAGAVCGYVIKATDQMTAQAPGAVKIRYSNVSLIGGSPQTNLFCRGAFGTYTNTVAFPGTTGNIRGFCLTIGDNGGPNGAAGEAVSNVTIANLHLYGMTNGNTFNNNFGYPPQTPTGDGWDITHKAIYMWDNSSFSNIVINSVFIQDFKAENIYSGGSPITGMIIENSTITNFNGNGISMLAADLQVLNNTISNGSNAAVENSTVSSGKGALIRQVYQGNTISRMPREGIVVVGVDYGVASGYVQIANNYFDTIAQVNASGTESAVYIASQGNFIPPANITVSGNTCHDCNTFGVFITSGNTVIQGNNFVVDQYRADSVFAFTYAVTNTSIINNTGSATTNAQAKGLTVGSVYNINPGYASGAFPWRNVLLKNNNWTFPGAPQYQFVTTSGLGWNLVTSDNLNWQGDSCSGCTHSDSNHGLVNLAATNFIEPYGPVVMVNGNPSPVTVTVNAARQENGSQIQIVNAGASPVSFVSDSNLSLGSPLTLPGGSNNSVTFVYNSTIGKFTTIGSETIVANAGSGQSTGVNAGFGTLLQAVVKDAGNSPLNGVSVTFTAPGSGASATFSGLTSVIAVTNSSGIATAPTLTANNQSGSYTVSASVSGVSTSASFNLNNIGTGPASISGLAGSGQSTNVNLGFGTLLQAVVKDAGNNPLSGVSVTFTAPSSGASATFSGLTSVIAVTNSSGIATAPTLTANNQSGSYTVSASVTGSSTSASFNLNNIAAGPASISGLAGSGQSTNVNLAFGTLLQAIVRDASNNPLGGVSVTFTAPGSGASATFSGLTSATAVTNSSGIATAPTLTANSQSGSYTISASVSAVSTSASFNLSNIAAAKIPSGSGSLSGSGSSAISPVNLTSEGSTDWVHWGDGGGSTVNRKSGVSPQISNFTRVGSSPAFVINNDPRAMSWTDGSPSAASNNNTEALYIDNLNNGFSFTVLASTNTQTLNIHVGGYASGGTLTAHLSDGSAPDYIDRTPNTNGIYDRNYVLTFGAASAGQTLTITWIDTLGGGNVTLSAAALK